MGMCLVETRAGLRTCNYKNHEAINSTEVTDRRSGLPHDVILRILSSFTLKEVVRTRLVSKRWEMWLLRYFPKFNFENPIVMKKLWELYPDNEELIHQEQSEFVRCVDRALKEHLGASIDDLNIKFYLDESYQHNIDKWVVFAFAKRVKRLELDFKDGCTFYRKGSELHRYSLPLECCKVLGVNHALASLCLKSVNITSQVVESLLHRCPFLENLCIEESEYLTDIRSSCSSLRLKHLDVSYCPRMQKIDISAPKMMFFRYYGVAIELKIRNASSLSRISIGGGQGVEVLYAFELLSQYFSQLELLSLQISLSVLHMERNQGAAHLDLQPFTRLKVLELCVAGNYGLSILGWVPLIEACIILEKLTLKFDCYMDDLHFLRVKRNGSPLKYLKTLELFGYRGYCVDFEIASFVLENAPMLQEVIVDVGIPSYSKDTIDQDECVQELRMKIPDGVKFVLQDSDSHLRTRSRVIKLAKYLTNWLYNHGFFYGIGILFLFYEIMRHLRMRERIAIVLCMCISFYVYYLLVPFMDKLSKELANLAINGAKSMI